MFPPMLFVNVAGIPFYSKTSVSDGVVQTTFGLVGLVAWVQVIRNRRSALAEH